MSVNLNDLHPDVLPHFHFNTIPTFCKATPALTLSKLFEVTGSRETARITSTSLVLGGILPTNIVYLTLNGCLHITPSPSFRSFAVGASCFQTSPQCFWNTCERLRLTLCCLLLQCHLLLPREINCTHSTKTYHLYCCFLAKMPLRKINFFLYICIEDYYLFIRNYDI